MNQEEFEEVFEFVTNTSREVLVQKAREYAKDGDRMHNFKVAAPMTGGTPEQALWGFLVKHLVSLRDMVLNGNHYPDAVWDEKIGDALNYLILLRALVIEMDRPDPSEDAPDAIDFHAASSPMTVHLSPGSAENNSHRLGVELQNGSESQRVTTGAHQE